MKLRRVLVAGSSGRLGNRIVSTFRDNWDITVLSRRPGAGAITLDACHADCSVDLSLDGYDLVVNCAAISSVAQCVRQPGAAWAVNSLWPDWLAERTAVLGIPMVHFSTDLVYAGGIPPYRETSPAVPASIYGWTKLLGDRAVLARNSRSAVLRTSILFGESGSGRATFSTDILQRRIDRVYVDSFRHHTSMGWLAQTAGKVIDSGFTGLVHAAGLHHQSRAAFAEALLRHRGMSSDELVQAYSPRGIPQKLALDMRTACAVLPLEPLDLASSICMEYPDD